MKLHGAKFVHVLLETKVLKQNFRIFYSKIFLRQDLLLKF